MKKFFGPLNWFFSIFLIIIGVVFSLTTPFVILVVPGLVTSPYINGLLEKLRKPFSTGGKLGTIFFGFALCLILINSYDNKPMKKDVQEEPRSQIEEHEPLKHHNELEILQNLLKMKDSQGINKNEAHMQDEKVSTLGSSPKTEVRVTKPEKIKTHPVKQLPEPISSTLSPSLGKDKINSICYGTVYTKGSPLNIRKGMGKNTEIIYRVPKGSNLLIFESIGDWYKVQLNDGRIGYVSKEYIKMNQMTPSTH